MLRIAILGLTYAAFGWTAHAQTPAPSKPPQRRKQAPPEGTPPPAATDVELVERVIASRKEYENSLKTLYEHYHRAGDKQRSQWIEKELMGYHLMWKPSYNLDVKDVPPPTLEAKVNVREANELFRAAMEYKGKGFGDDYVLNQRRAEIYFREILEKYPNSDKIARRGLSARRHLREPGVQAVRPGARVLRALVPVGEGLADRCAAPRRDALRPATQRAGKAIELYREEIAHDTDADRIRQAERRLGELTGNRK